MSIYILHGDTYNKVFLQFLKILTDVLRWYILAGTQVLIKLYIFCTVSDRDLPLQGICFLITCNENPSRF